MKIPLFDAHCDSVTKFCPLRRNCGQLDLRRLSAYAPAAQVFSVWAPDALACSLYTGCVLKHLRSQLQRSDDLVSICTTAEEAEEAAAAGKIAAFLSVEGAELLDCSAAELSRAYRLGVRMVNITWNRDNALAGAAMDGGGGLTPLGPQLRRGLSDAGHGRGSLPQSRRRLSGT